MDDRFFKQPILNSPYEYPSRHRDNDPLTNPQLATRAGEASS